MQGGPDKTRTVHVTQKTSQESQNNTVANTNNQLKKRNTTTDVACRVVHKQDKRSHRERPTQAAKQKDEKTKLEQKICVVQ